MAGRGHPLAGGAVAPQPAAAGPRLRSRLDGPRPEARDARPRADRPRGRPRRPPRARRARPRLGRRPRRRQRRSRPRAHRAGAARPAQPRRGRHDVVRRDALPREGAAVEPRRRGRPSTSSSGSSAGRTASSTTARAMSVQSSTGSDRLDDAHYVHARSGRPVPPLRHHGARRSDRGAASGADDVLLPRLPGRSRSQRRRPGAAAARRRGSIGVRPARRPLTRLDAGRSVRSGADGSGRNLDRCRRRRPNVSGRDRQTARSTPRPDPEGVRHGLSTQPLHQLQGQRP